MNSSSESEWTLDDVIDAVKVNAIEKIEVITHRIDADGMRQLAEALKENTSVHTIFLFDNQIGAQGARYLAEALKENRTVNVVNLSCNQIGSQESMHIAEALKVNNTVHALYLGGNQIGAEGARHFAEALKSNTIVHKIDLYGNQISDEGARHLADVLRVNSTVHTLYLWDNQIGDLGVQHLSDALKSNETIREINLSNNQIGIAGIRCLANALRVNNTVQELFLRSNQIGAVGAQLLAESLKHNTSVRVLHLADNRIGQEGAQYFEEALKENTTLRKIDLRYNNISKATIDKLNQTCTENMQYQESNQYRIDYEHRKAKAKEAVASKAQEDAEVAANVAPDTQGKEDANKHNRLLATVRVAPLLKELVAVRQMRARVVAAGVDDESLPASVVDILRRVDLSAASFPPFGKDEHILAVFDCVRVAEAAAVTVAGARTRPVAQTAARTCSEAFVKCTEAADAFMEWVQSVRKKVTRVSSLVAEVRGVLSADGLMLPVVLESTESSAPPLSRADIDVALSLLDEWIAKGKPLCSSAISATEAAAKALLTEIQRKWQHVLDVLGDDAAVEISTGDEFGGKKRKRATDSETSSRKRVKVGDGGGEVTVWACRVRGCREKFNEESACRAHCKEVHGDGEQNEEKKEKEKEEQERSNGECTDADELEHAFAALRTALRNEASVVADVKKVPRDVTEALKLLAARLLKYAIDYSAQHLRTFYDAIELCNARRDEFDVRGRGAPSVEALDTARKAERKAKRVYRTLHLADQLSEDTEDAAKADVISCVSLADARRLWREAATAYYREALKLASAARLFPELLFDARIQKMVGDNGSLTIGRVRAHYENWVVLAGTARHEVATATYNGERCAVKSFRLSNDAELRAFTKEVGMLGRLRHPHVVELCAAFTETDENGTTIGNIHMPFYEFGDLWAWKNATDPKRALMTRVLRGALMGLAHVHSHGVVHADVKPANIFVDAEHNAKLGDFDVSKDSSTRARLLTATAVSVATTVGFTPSYLSPELLLPNAVATTSSDVYAFGLTLFDINFATSATDAPPRPPISDVARGNAKVTVRSDCTDLALSDALDAMLNVDASQRVSAVDALSSLAYFMVATSYDEGVRQCCICGEMSVVSGGAVCATHYAHFVCGDCLLGYIGSVGSASDSASSLIALDGGVRCPINLADLTHNSAVYDDARLARVLPVDAFDTVMKVRERATEQRMVTQFEERRRAEEQRNIVERHRAHISELILTLSCPRCSQAFIDFDGCFALTCGRCKAAFCAWCLTDCGADAHAHVRQCEYGNGGVFGRFDEFERAQRERRTRMLRKYLESLPDELRKEVREACAREFRDLGVQL